jgi:hypothetical protein
MNERRNDLEIMNWISANCFADPKLGSISSLRCQKSRRHVCEDSACEVMFRGRYFFGRQSARLRPRGLRRASFAPRLLRGCATRSPKGEAWWSQTGSNRRPHACKARALPAELWPRTRRRMLLLRPSSPFGLCRARFTRLSTVAAPRVANGEAWWAWEDLNFRPHAYQARALTN